MGEENRIRLAGHVDGRGEHPQGVRILLTFDDGGEEVSLARTVFIPTGGDIVDEE